MSVFGMNSQARFTEKVSLWLMVTLSARERAGQGPGQGVQGRLHREQRGGLSLWQPLAFGEPNVRNDVPSTLSQAAPVRRCGPCPKLEMLGTGYARYRTDPFGRSGYSFGPDRSDTKRMFRYFLVFLPLLLLGGIACAAAVAATAPAAAEIVFLVCLGLFVAALADGVSEPGSERRE